MNELADPEVLERLLTERPADAAQLALRTVRTVERLRQAKGLALLRAEPPGMLLAAARNPRAKHVAHATPARPEPPEYHVALVHLRDLAQSDEDVLRWVETHGWHQAIWDECVFARGPVELPLQLRFESLKLDPETEALEATALRVLRPTAGLLPVGELAGVGFFDESLASLLEREDLRSPEVCLDLLERSLLAPFFSQARLASGAGAQVAKDVLAVMGGSVGHAHAVVRLLTPDGTPAFRPAEDPRWVDLLVRLHGHPRLRPNARLNLKRMDKHFADAAAARVVGTQKPPKGPAPPDPAVVAAADARAREAMRAVRASLEGIAARAKKSKVPLVAKGKTIAAVESTITAGEPAEIEKLTRSPIPSMLRAFYEIVGPVDLRPAAGATIPAELAAELAAPLVVQSLKRALRDLKARLRDNVGVPHALRDPVSLELSPDRLRVHLVPWSEDPALDGEEGTFLGHVRR